MAFTSNLPGKLHVDGKQNRITGEKSKELEMRNKKEQMTFTLEDAVEIVGFGKFQLKLLFILGLYYMSDAFEMQLLSVLAPVLKCEWHLTSIQVTIISTVVFIGMMLFAPLWGKMGDLYGRKTTVLFVACFTFFFGFLATFSPTYPFILITRGLVGGGIAGCSQSFVLLAEFLPIRIRAWGVLGYQTFWSIGSCVEIIMAAVVLPNLGWRYLVAFTSIPLIILIICFVFCPESPRYSIAIGKMDDALKVVTKLAQDNNKKLPAGVLTGKKQAYCGRLRDIFHPKLVRRTLQMWFLWFTATFTYYGCVILTPALLSDNPHCVVIDKTKEPSCGCIHKEFNDYVAMIIASSGELVGQVINVAGIEIFGRKKTLAFHLFGSSLFYLLLIICSSHSALVGFTFMIRAFTISCLNSCYIYSGEVYPTVIRAVGVGTCSSVARFGAVIATFVSIICLEYSRVLTFCFYGGVSFLAAVNALLLEIETKGRELEDGI